MNITELRHGTGLISPKNVDHLGIVIPTYNAASHWYALQAGLDAQGIIPSQVVVIDSSSTDGTQSLAQKAGYQVVHIRKEDFNHGATRSLACTYVPDATMLLFMTQDAVLAEPDAVEKLCSALDDPEIGAAYGRQLPRDDADPIERHGRLFNYPATSHVSTFESRKKFGFKAAFFSNSFAVYRRSALEEVGGFPSNVIVSEEVTAIARMLIAGWKVAYRADAVAIHSHPLSLGSEFSRYFDIGVHHGRERWILNTFGTTTGDGLRYAKAEAKFLCTHSPFWLPYSALRIVSKYVAYFLGRREQHLPLKFRQLLSGYPTFWDDHAKPIPRKVETDPHSSNPPAIVSNVGRSGVQPDVANHNRRSA